MHVNNVLKWLLKNLWLYKALLCQLTTIVVDSSLISFYNLTMSSRSQYNHPEKYGSCQVKTYAQYVNEGSQMLAFFFPAVTEYLQSTIPGKKVLDIGCGSGKWSYQAALCGAKSVDGFDINEEMVQLAKQTTSQFSTVNIQVGDVMKMPYDDNVFDVALSFYVTITLQREAFISHFKELYRVLVPGGKAAVVNFTKAGFEKMYLSSGTDRMMMEDKIKNILMNLKSHPSYIEIKDAFQIITDVVHLSFGLDQNGKLERIGDVAKMTNGQATWAKSEMMIFTNYFYSEQFFQQQIKAAGLNIDKIESYYTEARRIAYNSTNPEIKLDKITTDDPPFVLYHLSKPMNNFN